MNHPSVPARDSLRRDPAPLLTRIALAVLFLLGAVLVLLSLGAQKEAASSGFSSDGSYPAIAALSRDAADAWEKHIQPDLASLTDQELEALDLVAAQLLRDAWEELRPGGAADAEALIGPDAGANRPLTFRLLYATWLISGLKVNAAGRKAVTALQDTDAAAFRHSLLRCLADDTLPLPAEAEAPAGPLSGRERRAMLLQLYFVSCGSGSSEVTEHANLFKKSIRDKKLQPDAFRMIAEGRVSRLHTFMLSHSRTAILLGITLMTDVLLLALLMRAEQRWVFDFKWILILLIVDFLLFFQVLPVVYMVVKALSPNGRFSLDTLKRLTSYPLNLDALRNTLLAAFFTMILGTLIAFPLAWLVGRTNLYGRKFFRSLFVTTYMVPPYVGAMAWLRLMNPNVGTVNQWLRMLFHLPDAPGPLNVYSLPGLIWVLTTFYYPYAFITVSRAMEKMDPSLEEAGRISGASPLKTVFTVTLPMMMPSLIAGALLVFVSAASCYGIPSIIGTPGNVSTVTTRIVEYVSLGQQGMNDATALALFLMLVALVILFLSDVVLARRQYITVSGKSVQPSIVHLRRWRLPLTILVSLFALVVVVLPFFTILLTSFKTDIGRSVTAPGNFTLKNWSTVFARKETISCLKNSLLYATAAASAGLVISCVMSYLLQRTRIRGRNLPNFLITLGSGTPSVVIALGLIMTMRGSFGVNIYNTAWILIVAYLIKHLMMGMRTVTSAMSQIHVSLEECSQISGAGWLRTMLRITGPLIFPSIAAGWFLIFIPSFYELSMTTLLYSSTTKTIGFQLYETWTFTSQPMSCAMAFGILLFVVFLNFILNRLTKGGFSI